MNHLPPDYFDPPAYEDLQATTDTLNYFTENLRVHLKVYGDEMNEEEAKNIRTHMRALLACRRMVLDQRERVFNNDGW